MSEFEAKTAFCCFTVLQKDGAPSVDMRKNRVLQMFPTSPVVIDRIDVKCKGLRIFPFFVMAYFLICDRIAT